MKKPSFRIKEIMLLLIPIVLAIIVYSGVFGYGYVNWDDDDNIRFNRKFVDISGENVIHHYNHDRYKALAIWSYMIEYQVGGESPRLHHITNLLLHLVNIVLVFVFIKKLLKGKRYAPLIVAALFAVHPAFVEAVAWITGRKDLLFVLFSLLSFLAYIKYLTRITSANKYIWLVAVVILTYIASLAKIQALALPIVLFGLDWLFQRKISWQAIVEKLVLFFVLLDSWTITFAFLIIWIIIQNRSYLKSFFVSKYYAIVLLSFYWIILHVLASFANSCRLLGVFDFIMWIFAAFALALSVVVVLAIFKRSFSQKIQSISQRNKAILTIFLVVLILIFLFDFQLFNTMGVVRNNFSLSNFMSQNFGFWNNPTYSDTYFPFGERFLLLGFSFLYYLKRLFQIVGLNPMVPYPTRATDGSLPVELWSDLIAVIIIAALTTFVLFRFFRKNRLVWFAVLFFLINIGLVLHIIPIEGRVMVADRYTYLAYIGLFLLVGLVADYFIERKRGAIVIGIFGVMLLAMSWTTYRDKAVWQNSFSFWQRAMAVNPENHYAMYSLALAYFVEGNDPVTAEQYFNQAIKLKSDFTYFNNRGRVLYALGNPRGALSDFDSAIALDSMNFASFNNRGVLRQHFCDFKGALNDYNKAIQLWPDYTEAINNKQKVMGLILMDSILFSASLPVEVTQQRLTDFVLITSEKLIKTEQTEKAITYLQAGIKLFKSEARFYEKIAIVHHLKGEFAEEKKYLDMGLVAVPDNPSLLLGRGYLYIQTGDTLKACADLQIAASKGDANAQNLLKQYCK